MKKRIRNTISALLTFLNEVPRTYTRGFLFFKPSATPAKAGNRFTHRIMPVVLRMNNRKIIFSLLSIFILFLLAQSAVFQIPYFQALAQCLDPSNPRADYLITSPTQGNSNRFTSRIGTCIFDPQASIGEFRQTSYQQLFEEFYIKSKIPQNRKFSYPPTGDTSPFIMNTTTTLGDESVYLVKENFYIDGSPTAPPVTTLVYIEKDLHIRTNFTYGSPNKGIVFIVRGSVFIYANVTQFDGVIIAQGGQSNTFSICTGADPGTGTCPVSSIDVGSNALVVNGSMIALDRSKPIRFTRKLASNVTAAEQVNHQVKYLSILNNLLSKPTNVVSEGTNYAICTADTEKPAGCPCDPTAEPPQCIGGRTYCQDNICQPPTGPIQGGTIQQPPASTPTPTPEPSGSIVPPRLVAHWTMDEETGDVVRDHIGGNHGSTPGSTVVGGRFGLARELANGSFITVNDSPAFRSQYTSVSSWVYPKNLTTRPYASLFNRRNAQNQYSFIVELDGTGGVQCYGNGQRAHSGTTKLTMRTWSHVVCTYDGNAADGQHLKLFINNVKVGFAAAPGILANPANPSVQLGRNIANGQSFIGFLDDIKVYSYALSVNEINTLYTQTPTPGVPANRWENPWRIYTERQVDEYIINI